MRKTRQGGSQVGDVRRRAGWVSQLSEARRGETGQGWAGQCKVRAEQGRALGLTQLSEAMRGGLGLGLTLTLSLSQAGLTQLPEAVRGGRAELEEAR